jgi:hypothetical protein
MNKRSIGIAVILYIILGAIAYFNFGFHNLMVQKWVGKGTPNKSAWQKLEENIRKAQTEAPHKSQDTFSVEEPKPEDPKSP